MTTVHLLQLTNNQYKIFYCGNNEKKYGNYLYHHPLWFLFDGTVVSCFETVLQMD